MGRLFISFSGGRTSAYMTHRLLESLPPNEQVVVLFSNTGQEHEGTLEFVNQCDKHFGFNTVWIEADVQQGKRAGTRHRIVSFETASRDGKPFEEVIQKYGIPNKNFPHCTRELKLNPMTSYLRSIGWKAGSYEVAIGIRADEMDRMSSSAAKNRLIYPLVKWGVTKQDVVDWWKKQPFDLTIPEHLGNCTWCWKKSLRKHMTLTVESPSVFDFPRRMEALYHDRGPGDFDRPRRFFRKNTGVEDIFAAAEAGFDLFVDKNHRPFDPYLDAAGSCSESCEVFAEEDGE